jgi:hypothetical protein
MGWSQAQIKCFCWNFIFNHPHRSQRGSELTIGVWYHQSPLGTDPFMCFSMIRQMPHFGRYRVLWLQFHFLSITPAPMMSRSSTAF